MKFASTRGGAAVALDDALLSGIAPDGGLFVPRGLPRFEPGDFAGAASLAQVAARLLAPFFAESRLASSIDDIMAETFTFPVPLRPLEGTRNLRLLELFHGPTAAFKDVGARFLAACIQRLDEGAAAPLTILVATSGDTGAAVAAAFDGRPAVRVVVLFPAGRVSARQAHQLSCWGDNVLSLAVQGSFDDCQRLVKQAMARPELAARWRFGSANSINIGRLLPQCTYYAQSCLAHYRETGRKPGFIVPTGNLGNALACMLVRGMGLPVHRVVLATNANRGIVDWLEGEEWQPRQGIPTLATAMDVGDPSNLERVRRLFGEAAAVARDLRAFSATDADIEREIAAAWQAHGVALCPHTATARHAWRELPESERNGSDWILVATAHPAKFERVVEPIIGRALDVPPALAEVLERPAHAVPVPADLDAVERALCDAFAA